MLITPEKWLLPIYNNAQMHNEKLAKLKPDIYLGISKIKDKSDFLSVRGAWDDVGTWMAKVN